jgi:hypothetical protein
MVAQGSRSTGVLAIAVWVSLASAPASATIDCVFSCTPPGSTDCACVDYDAGDECVITTVQSMAAGALVDCSGEDIRLQDQVEVSNGFVTVKARNLTIDTYRNISATRTSGETPFGIIIELSGQLDMTGVLRANSDSGGGAISVEAQGDILLPPYAGGSDGILANATAPGAPGGTIELVSGGNVVIDDPLIADGSADGVAEGGEILIRATGDITIRDRLSVFGHHSDGGVVTLTTENGTVTVQDSIKAEGGGTSGNGGEIHLTGKRVVLDAALSAQGGVGFAGGLGTGGSVQIDAGLTGIAFNADIDVTGGQAGSGLNGGAIVAESEGPIAIANGVTLLTKSDANGGNGGDIVLESDSQLSIGTATLDARGDWVGVGQGEGAALRLRACQVSIASGAYLDARGHDGGAIAITGRETITISASSVIDASANGGDPGSVTLAYRVTGRCAASPAEGCDVAQCQGTCSNNATLACTSNANCTDGCGTGQCLFPGKCSDDANAACSTVNDCTGCSTGSCTANANPDTGGTTAQFHPSPPQLLEAFNLAPCN